MAAEFPAWITVESQLVLTVTVSQAGFLDLWHPLDCAAPHVKVIKGRLCQATSLELRSSLSAAPVANARQAVTRGLYCIVDGEPARTMSIWLLNWSCFAQASRDAKRQDRAGKRMHVVACVLPVNEAVTAVVFYVRRLERLSQ